MSSSNLTYIAWFGALPILLLFLGINWKTTNTRGKVWLPIIIYCLSIVTAILIGRIMSIGGMDSRVVAGIVAPIFYSILTTIFLKVKSIHFLDTFKKSKGVWHDPEGELLDSFFVSDDEDS